MCGESRNVAKKWEPARELLSPPSPITSPLYTCFYAFLFTLPCPVLAGCYGVSGHRRRFFPWPSVDYHINDHPWRSSGDESFHPGSVPHLPLYWCPVDLLPCNPPPSSVSWYVNFSTLARVSPPRTCISGLSRGEGCRCHWRAASRLPSVCLVSRPVGVDLCHMLLAPTPGWFSSL